MKKIDYVFIKSVCDDETVQVIRVLDEVLLLDPTSLKQKIYLLFKNCPSIKIVNVYFDLLWCLSWDNLK